MPKLSEGKFALGGLAIFAVWVFAVLPVLYYPPPRFAETNRLHSSPKAAEEAAQDLEIKKSLLSLIPVIAGVLATGLVGAELGFLWNLELKRRESDLATLKVFRDLYGEFFAVWKLWNCYIRDIGPDAFPDASRWKLLERAAASEGGMEAILIGLASKHRSSPTSLEALGQFRQLYQQLRKSIRSNRALEWDHSGHPVYMAFKQSGPIVAYMIRTGRNMNAVISNQQTEAWLEVTHNRHEKFWLK